MELALELCTVRSWRADDAAAIAHHANNYNVWRNLRDRFPHPYTRVDAEAWLHRVCHAVPETDFALDVGGAAIGGIGFTIQEDIHRHSAELGYWLGEEFWGRGIATQAVRAVTSYAFATHDLYRLYAGVFEWNHASRCVLEKAGFACEGRLRQSVVKDGQFIDQFLYAITRD